MASENSKVIPMLHFIQRNNNIGTLVKKKRIRDILYKNNFEQAGGVNPIKACLRTGHENLCLAIGCL